MLASVVPVRPGDETPAEPHGGAEIVVPELGLLINFPAWLNRYVNPYHGGGTRISVSFNLNVEIIR